MVDRAAVGKWLDFLVPRWLFICWVVHFFLGVCVCARVCKIIFKPVAHLRWKNEPDTEPYMNLKVVSRKWHTVDGRSFRIAEYEDGYKEWLLGLKGFFSFETIVFICEMSNSIQVGTA